MLQIPYLVIHPGTAGKNDKEKAHQQLVHNLNLVMSRSKGITMLLLENMAGQGSSICHTFQELGAVIKETKYNKQIGVCIDTCHAFAAGYDFTTKDLYETFIENIDTHIGLNKVKILHLNDSKKERGLRVDRHEDIAKGKIGPTPFSFIMNDERFFDIPKIIETPHTSPQDNVRNMQTLIALLTKETKIKLNVSNN